MASSRKRVAWDGPDPKPGEYLAGTRAGEAWFIRAVEPIRLRGVDDDTRLVLDLIAARLPLPERAVVHPRTRTTPSTRDGPPRVRQTAPAGGIAAVMKTAWRDPDDIRPSAARAPRKITGFRTYCPLRRNQALAGSSIEERHILAADRLRRTADIAAIGMSAGLTLEPRMQGYGPTAGPSEAKMGQAHAARELHQALQRFTPTQRHMLTEIVLLNRSLPAWCATLARAGTPDEIRVDPKLELGKLIAVLDMLAQHYQQEIQQDLDADRLMGEA